MKIGFLTACLREMTLPEQIQWAGENGFRSVELHAVPLEDNSPYGNGALNVRVLEENLAKEIRDAASKHGVEISCIIYTGNLLSADEAERASCIEQFGRVLECARMLNVDVASCFAGRDRNRPIAENVEEAKRLFSELARRAADMGVRIAIENSPRLGVPFEGLVGNIAFSPPIWRELFNACADIGLNFDPSHLLWMGIDYVAAVHEFRKHIFHVHAKDAEVLKDRLAEAGILTPSVHWWRYRLPGLGQLDWARFISALQEIGYDGALSIEHEDPLWHGEAEKVKAGLRLAQRHLAQFLP